MIILYVIGIVLWCSICEWLLHKYLMHKPLLGFRYPYERHAMIHHTIFKSDDSYQLLRDEDKKTIPMAKWNGVVIAILAGMPMFIFGYKMFILTFVIAYCYYGVYEFIHWCMHLPKQRGVEYRWWYKKLNGHHILHHRYTNKNYNVVLPFADWLFGTLLLRSPIKFKQCEVSYCVPNVQPE